MTSVAGGLGLALFEDRYIQDPYPLYQQMHQAGPVHRIGESGFYAVSSWAAVNEAVARCGDFSSNLTATMMHQPGGTVGTYEIGELGGASPGTGHRRRAGALAASKIIATAPGRQADSSRGILRLQDRR